tara:strand:- start:187 stop:528 length:342 start_codon:yes stop_codon:yes gene_type:complete
MAYLNKNDLVIIRSGDTNLQARVVDMQFRRFRKSWQDKKSGEWKYRWKSVPYAICECFIGAPAGTEFLIPGYKLKNETKDGERLLVLRDKYAAEFDGAWVKKMLATSKEKRSA